ncbi:MAG TPA: iron-sulfur cluster assembly protein [Bdellovibrionota bacterium]|nr:iron-sulfur cluster assembly protein [Bdellovibrionota bacterium]
MTTELTDRIWDTLRECYDPEIPVNIVDLGLIYGVSFTEAESGSYKINILMTLTAPGCAMGEWIKQDIETKLRELPNVRGVEIEFAFDPPWTPERMTPSARLELNLI